MVGQCDHRLFAVRVRSGPDGVPIAESARRLGATPGQMVFAAGLLAATGAVVGLRPAVFLDAVVLILISAFFIVALWRFLLVILALGRVASAVVPEPPDWPRYTVVAALHDEADIVAQLIGRLARLDYPPHRLEGFLVLEAHDHETIEAALSAPRPSWLQILVAPPGAPRTKPRALNIALERAGGRLLTVYDAEDEPDPLQLREAAARFAADTSNRLACLQAPLRIRTRSSRRFLDRQFAAEYASLFDVVLPGMARLGLPFPLGGTSNHFRIDVLRAIGGWDAWNVTEDADLGFRLWRRGWRMGVLDRPTWETPPGPLEHWLPQRTRWLKGYMQTWGVHTRKPWRLGPRGLLSMTLTLGAGLASAALHGPSLVWIAATVLVAAADGLSPEAPRLALSVLALGAASAWLSCAVGARRAGVPYGPADMIAAPAYWSLLSLAFVHALWRLIRQPFAWDKTCHRAEAEPVAVPALDERPPDRLSAAYAASPEPVA